MTDPLRSIPDPPHHLLVQAPVPAVDVDGVRVVGVGTLLFALATVLTGVFHGPLAAAGRGWWVGVCASGTALGLVGLLHCRQRVRQRRHGTGPVAPGGDAATTRPRRP